MSGGSVTQAKTGRLLDIDRAKGFGIALVVWGHMFKTGTFDQPFWMEASKNVIYQFHMPFFMYLSGFVYFITSSQTKFFQNAGSFVAKRFDRLMVPFVLFGLLVLLAKLAAQTFTKVDDPANGFLGGVVAVLTNRPDNPSISIWYLLVLFIYSVVTPLLWKLSGGRISVLLAIGLLGWAFPLPEAYYLQRIAIFFLFFAAGGAAALHRDRILPLFKRFWIPALLVWAGLCYVFYGIGFARLACGLAAIPAFHGLFLQKWWEGDRVVLCAGKYSMTIYLLNTIFIGLAKVAYSHILPWRELPFVLFALFVFFVGMIGPIVIKLVLDKMRPLRPVARYLD